MQSQTSLDGAGAAATGAVQQPYVEAYVEYPGPLQKWSGPSSYILHVTAKDVGPAQITTTPALLTEDTQSSPAPDPVDLVHRTPAASAASQAISPAIHRMSSEEAREQLAHLANALQGAQAPFHGCMSPVRVRMVRADGGILERQGCRSELGWSRAVSEAVSNFVDASLHGSSRTLPPEPQSRPEPATSGSKAALNESGAQRSVAGKTGP